MTPIVINQKMIQLSLTINESLSEMLDLININKDESMLKDVSNIQEGLDSLIEKLSKIHKTHIN